MANLNRTRAREWRERVALSADNADKLKPTIRTYKYPLNLNGAEFDMTAVRAGTDIVSGVGKGSLLGFLCAVQIAGFRIFARSADATGYWQRDRYPTQGFIEVRNNSLLSASMMIPFSIEQLITTIPRKSLKEWDTETIKERFYRSWTGKSLVHTGSSSDDDIIFEAVCTLATKLMETFGSWAGVSKNLPEALAIVDGVLSKYGEFPPLANMSPLKRRDAAIATSTVAWDVANDDAHECAEDMMLHQLVALRCADIRNDISSGILPSIEDGSTAFRQELQNRILTSNYNGLCWLLGRGLKLFQTESIDVLCEWFEIPESAEHQLSWIKSYADAIPLRHPFLNIPYSDFRRTLGGKASSWIANYYNRLMELDALSTIQLSVSPALCNENMHWAFKDVPVGPDGLADALNSLTERTRTFSATTMAVLTGRINGDIMDAARDLEDLSHLYSDTMVATRTVNKTIKVEIKGEKDKARRTDLTSMLLPTKEVPRLNRIGGGTINPDVFLAQHCYRFNLLQSAQRAHILRFSKWIDDNDFASPQERLAVLLGDREQAVRHVLDTVVRMFHCLRDISVLHNLLLECFSDHRQAHRYLHNKKGYVYLKPGARRRVKPLTVNVGVAWRIKWHEELLKVADETMERARKENSVHAFRDAVLIENTAHSIAVRASPEIIPRDISRLEHLDDDVLYLPATVRLSLEREHVSRSSFLRAWNLYTVNIQAALPKMSRNGFMLRHCVNRIGAKGINYVPKKSTWTPPATLSDSENELAEIVRANWVHHTESGDVDVTNSLKSMPVESHKGHVLLRQLPHTWSVSIPRHIVSESEKHLAIALKGNGGIRGKFKETYGFTFNGPPTLQRYVDRALGCLDIEIAEHAIIIEEYWSQEPHVDGDGIISLKGQQQKVNASIALPFNIAAPDNTTKPIRLFDHFVALDFNTHELGVAVFSIDAKPCDPPIATDIIPLKPLRALLKEKARHRTELQPKQKLQASFSHALAERRKSVVGILANIIDNVCAKYQAWPLFESTFDGGGSRDVKALYDQLLALYTFSDVDAHTVARKQRWANAFVWTHPTLLVKDINGKPKPLKLGPGAMLHPAGCNTPCVKCYRDPIAAIKSKYNGRINVTKEGRVTVDDGELIVMAARSYTSKEERAARRQWRWLPPNVALSAGSHKTSVVVRTIMENLRTPHDRITHAKSMQSLYRCLYVDCRHEQHADVVAATNFGRKFLRDKVFSEKGCRDAPGRLR
ncbi:MAG: type V CRISPR-associated protein Cas12c [Gammaproteobacteria bacterium]